MAGLAANFERNRDNRKGVVEPVAISEVKVVAEQQNEVAGITHGFVTNEGFPFRSDFKIDPQRYIDSFAAMNGKDKNMSQEEMQEQSIFSKPTLV